MAHLLNVVVDERRNEVVTVVVPILHADILHSTVHQTQWPVRRVRSDDCHNLWNYLYMVSGLIQ